MAQPSGWADPHVGAGRGLSRLVRHAEGRRLRKIGTSIRASEEVDEVRRRARALLNAPATTKRLEGTLRSGDAGGGWAAKAAALEAGIDVWPHAFDRQAVGSEERLRDHWLDLMQTDDEGHIERVLDLALRQLPLYEIASGPADEMGLGFA